MSKAASLEFADPASGVRGLVEAGSPGLSDGEAIVLLFEGTNELIAERSSSAKLTSNDGAARAEASTGEISFSAELKPGAAGPLSAGRATVELDRKGKKRSFECFAALAELPGLGDGGADGVLRRLFAIGEDGSTLALRSYGASGAVGHGEEQTEAWLIEADAAAPRSVTEPLLSTQYDPGGAHARAGLELWVGNDDQLPLRGAGTRLAGTGIELDGWGLEAAFFEWTVEGVAGSGSYLIWRPVGG